MTTRKRKKKQARIYWRSGRAWADFRSHADVGGRLEPLTPQGERLATTDDDVAQALVALRLTQLDGLRRGRALHGRAEGTPLASYAAEHLQKKAQAAKVTRDWIAAAEVFLRRAVDFLGADTDLEAVTVEKVQAWAAHLATLPAKRDTRKPKDGKPLPPRIVRTMSGGTVRHSLNALSNLYRRAQAEGKVPPGFNPVAAMLEKPAGTRREAHWLEVPDAALLLESARTLPPDPHHRDGLTADVAHALLATYLLTGGRSSEVLGLEVEDISFNRETVTYRINDWRRLKTLKAARVVPLHPQLGEILRAYVFSRPPARLLFPSFLTGSEAMITDWRKTLDRVAVRAGWKKGEIRTRMFRHTYCAARLQTLDGGAPISPFTVSRELGHGSGAMVENVYSHLGTIRHRTDSVEYRVAQHAPALADRLQRLGIVSEIVTTGANASQQL